MKGAIGIGMVFIAMSVLLYLGLSMVASIPEPAADSDEYETYQGLSKILDISYSGFWIVLILIAVMAIIAAFKIKVF